MKIKHVISTVLLHFIVLSAHTSAAVISLVPSSTSIDVGESVSVELAVSDLGADILTSFNLDFLFDDSVLNFESFVFGDPINGDQLDLLGFAGGIFQTLNASSDSVSVGDVSINPDSLLLLSQLDDFILGTFTFTALSIGSNDFVLKSGLLGGAFDLNFISQPVDFTFESAGVSVTDSVAVNSPASSLLIVLGCFLLSAGRKKAVATRY